MNITSRDWPPDPQPKPGPPNRRVAVMLLTILLLLLGSPLAAWLVAALPGDQPWAPVIVPGCWFTALLVFLAGSYLNIKNGKK
jgi:hypothetical protein